MSKYRNEPPISKADREAAGRRAIKGHRTIHALTIVCRDEADQIAMFPRLGKIAGGRKIKVVVS
jgi:hypothetical protein